MIQLISVAKYYDNCKTCAVSDVDIHVQAGQLVVLLGESGCGKTTTLKMINGLIEPTCGTIEVEGEDICFVDPTILRRSMGYVFQGIGLFPHMSITENVAVVPTLLGWSPTDITERVNALLTLVGLEPGDYGPRFPAQLSGGQQQRVGLARALAGKPKIMLMDEPFGALDPLTRDQLQDEFRRIHDHLSLTTVMVTHDMTEALLMADRIVVMRAGSVLQSGTPAELLQSPAHDYVAQLIGTPKRQADRLKALADVRPA